MDMVGMSTPSRVKWTAPARACRNGRVHATVKTSTFGLSPMVTAWREISSFASQSPPVAMPTRESADTTRVAFSNIGSIRRSMSRVARELPHS